MRPVLHQLVVRSWETFGCHMQERATWDRQFGELLQTLGIIWVAGVVRGCLVPSPVLPWEPHGSVSCIGRWRCVSDPGRQIYRCSCRGCPHPVPDPAEPGRRVRHPVHKASEAAEQLHGFCQQPLQFQAGLGHLLLGGWPGWVGRGARLSPPGQTPQGQGLSEELPTLSSSSFDASRVLH